jgi:hypothetical protein
MISALTFESSRLPLFFAASAESVRPLRGNPKSETRITNQIRNPNDRMEPVSDFVIQISDFSPSLDSPER